MRILVTGGAGRLGSEVVKLLAAKGHAVVAFDLPQVNWEAIRDMHRVEAFPGDITNLGDVMEACLEVDGVIHLAAFLPPKSEANRDLTTNVNVEGTRNVIRAVEGRPGAPVVFASSVSAYGITAVEEPPISENHPLRVHNYYSESKIEAERLIRGSGVPFVILRISPIAVADVVELPETIPYRADQRVEHVYVSDAARALLASLEKPESLGQTYNIAGGTSWWMTGAEYIERFYGALGVEVEPNFSKEYMRADWYDTSWGRFLGYQRTPFNAFLERLRALGEQLGLR